MAFNTTNLDLTVWDLLNDQFNHTELASNWSKLDVHNHVPIAMGGDGGVPIPEDGIAPNAISNGKLVTGAVDSRVIATNAVTGTELLSDDADDGLRAVTTDHIKDENVTLPKLVAFPSARLSRSSSQTISTIVATKVAFDTADFVTDGVNPGLGEGRLAVEVEGVYLVTGQFTWAAYTSAFGPWRTLYIVRDGGPVLAEQTAYAMNNLTSTKQGMTVSWVGALDVDEYVELWARTNGGQNTGTLAGLSLSYLSHL